jgi:hypothetical protein
MMMTMMMIMTDVCYIGRMYTEGLHEATPSVLGLRRLPKAPPRTLMRVSAGERGSLGFPGVKLT